MNKKTNKAIRAAEVSQKTLGITKGSAFALPTLIVKKGRPVSKRICIVEGCGKKYFAKNYCNYHYQQSYLTGHPLGKFKGNRVALSQARRERIFKNKIWEEHRIAFICKIENCGQKHYARGYCKKHYQTIILRKGYKKHLCGVDGCLHQIYEKSKYCVKHSYRAKHNLPLDLSIKCTQKGEKNYMWKGGVAEYPNHYLMKKNRLVILAKYPICQICNNKPSTEVHHRNGDKSDHSLENLAASCHPCNSSIRFKPNNSKYFRLYGMNLETMRKKFGGYYRKYYYLHKKGKLKDFMNRKVLMGGKLNV